MTLGEPVHLVDAVLFLHIVVAVAAFGVATVMHTIQWVSRGATSIAQLKAWNPVAHRLEPMFPVLALVLFGLGAWLLGLSDGEFSWSDGWVITAAVGLGVMELAGAVLISKRAKNVFTAIEYAPEGPIGDGVRAVVMNPVLWATSHFETGTAIGILYLMAVKPSAAASVAIVVACAAAGAAVGAAGARSQAVAPAEVAPAV
jgi:hypothetical protein